MSRTQDNNETIDFAGMIREAFKKWYVFLISVVVCVGLAFFYSRTHSSEYLVKANLIISQEDDTSPAASMAGLGSLFGSSANVDDEVYAVSSHTVLKNVVKELGLNQRCVVKTGFMQSKFCYNDNPVVVKCAAALPDTLRTGVVFKIKVADDGNVDVTAKARKQTIAEVENGRFPVVMKTPYGVFTLDKTPYLEQGEETKAYISYMGYDDAAEQIGRNVDIDIASRKSNVIELEMESSDIEYAKDVLNTIIEQYNIRGLEEKNARNRKTLAFVDSRLARLGDDLVSSESNIESFKKSNGIVDVEAEATYQITKKGEFEKELIETETRLEIIKMIKEFMSDPENRYELVPSTLAEGNNGGKQGGALDAYNEMLLKRITLLQDAHGGNAALKTINGQIDALRKNILQTIDRNYESTSIKLRDLKAQMGQTESRLGNIPAQERQFRDILRQQTIKEQLYIFLLQQREETSMMLANSKFKGQIIDEAYALNEPLGMGRMMMLMIAFVAGIALGVLYLYVKKLMRNKFETREELERLTSVPVLGEMCTDHSGRALVVKEGGSTSAAELFRLMRTNLQFILSGNDDKVILLTSTISGEGKSFISINLASSLALLNKRVLLVGLDIRNPKLQEYLELPPAPGFTEYIAGDRYQLKDIIRRNAVAEGMDVITSGPVPPNPSELLNSDKVDATFAELRRMYDFIVIDSAPVGMVSDTFSLNRVCDATVYVTRANYSTMKEVGFFNSLYRDARLKKMSIVVNGTHSHKGYGYGYGHGYGHVEGSKGKKK